MNKKKQVVKAFVLSLALGLGLAGVAAAQFTGPSTVKLGTVAEVLKNGVDDQHVALRDNLVKKKP